MAEPNRPEHRPGSTDPHDLHGEVPSGPRGDPDRDVNTKMIWRIAVGLAIGTTVAAAAMLALFFFERHHLDRSDPAPSPIAEARAPQTPPGPLLQRDPNQEMKAFRASEERLLSTFGWTDRSAGVARLPIARAMDIVARRGVGPLEPNPSAEPEPARMEMPERRPTDGAPAQETSR